MTELKSVVIGLIKDRFNDITLSSDRLDKISTLILKTHFPSCKQLHSQYAGFISHTCDYVGGFTGRRYKGKLYTHNCLEAINNDYPMFEIVGVWKKGESTKGYKLRSWLANGINQWLQDTYINTKLEDSELCDAKKKAISTVDSNGNRRKTKGNIRYGVRINRKALQALYPTLIDEREKNHCLFLLLMSDGETLPRGWIPQTYKESAAGRLYGQGLNLQNIKKKVRKAALMGTTQLDMSNAHYTILAQSARSKGVELEAIEFYLTNKPKCREEISRDTSLSIKSVKQALISLIYGASTRARYLKTKKTKANPTGIKRAAIRDLCYSDDQFNLLVNHPIFSGIAADVEKGGDVLINSCRARGDFFYNVLGKPIAKTEPKAKITAHLLQGVEAKALDAVIKECGHNIALLLHDGIGFYSYEDPEHIEQLIEKETGYKITMEVESCHDDSITCHDTTESPVTPHFSLSGNGCTDNAVYTEICTDNAVYTGCSYNKDRDKLPVVKKSHNVQPKRGKTNDEQARAIRTKHVKKS